MPTWPPEFKHLTVEQAWGFVRGDTALGDLPDKAKRELAGLSAWGESGKQAEMLSRDVDICTLTKYPPQSCDPEHIRSGLMRLGISDPEQNSGIPGYDPWAE